MKNRSPNETDEQLWLPLPGESNAWYQRFCAYLQMGAGRSVRSTYNREKGNVVSKAVPGSWTEASRRFDWQGRAAAYDAWRRTEIFQTGNASDEERVKKLDVLLEKMHARLMAEIDTMEVNDRFLDRYLGAMDLMAKATGGYAPQRVEHSGKLEVEETKVNVLWYMPQLDKLPDLTETGDAPEISDVPADGETATLPGESL